MKKDKKNYNKLKRYWKLILKSQDELDNSNNYNNLEIILNNTSDKISSFMKTSIKTLEEYLAYIKNILSNSYHNEFVEGNNNFIKVLKRIDFGFRLFTRFKVRIIIFKGLINPKEKEAKNLSFSLLKTVTLL